MIATDLEKARIAIVSKDLTFAEALRSWLGSNDGELSVVLDVPAWGQLLNDSLFPTDLVVLDAESSRRNSIESRVRTIRATGTAVLVVCAADSCDDPARAIAAGAFCVLAKSVPPGLIAEMARAAMGIPVAG